jgi:hypothetical protein
MRDGHIPYEAHVDRWPAFTTDEGNLIVALTGWIDASGAAAAAATALVEHLRAEPILTFDDDTFIDFRARRPTMEIRNGRNERLVWPRIQLLHGARDGKSALVLTGPEPDMAWNLFMEHVITVATSCGIDRVVGLGAYPIATPHTRPTLLSMTTTSDQMLADLPFLTSSVDVPAGIEAALEHAFAAQDVPAVGLWAQVPHYVAAMPYPAASVALLDGLEVVTGISTPAESLRAEAAAQRQRLDQLVEGNDEHRAMLTQLEAAYDLALGERASEARPTGERAHGLPSGDQIAFELERFLREHDD